MTSRFSQDQIDAYLDHRMTREEQEFFEQRLATDLELRREVQQQATIDAAVASHFSPAAVGAEDVEHWLADDAGGPLGRTAVWRRRALVVAGLALAALVAWLALIARWNDRPDLEPFFEPRAMAQIYLETIEQGFRPYYLCDDEQRFTRTFAKRQGIALRLAQLPPGRSMAGLSYPGGLSRQTTAMLCRVDDEPVMVFVDRKAVAGDAITAVPQGSGLHVHSEEIGDLVLYEVTPFAEPKVLEFLQIVQER